jgi:hypothetical protein
MSDYRYVCTKIVAKLLGVTVNYLEKDRYYAKLTGRPPLIPYYPLGKRDIRYKLSEVHAYMASRRVGA